MKTNFPIYQDEKLALEYFSSTGEEEWEVEFSKTKIERAKFIKGLFPDKPAKTSLVAHIRELQKPPKPIEVILDIEDVETWDTKEFEVVYESKGIPSMRYKTALKKNSRVYNAYTSYEAIRRAPTPEN